MKNKYIFFFVVAISIAGFSLHIISCTKKSEQRKEIKISIEDPANTLSNKEKIIGEELIGEKYKIKIVKPDEKIDYKILMVKPEKDTDPNMIIVNPNISNATDNAVPDDISNQIKDFIIKIEKEK